MGGNAEENANHAETFPLKEKYLPQFFFPPQNMNNPKSLSNMFCDKHHVNQLTSLLHQHQICDCVVCPGSRNAILIHNFKQAGFQLYPVTDERSAAFVALGICLQRQSPVAICVTSGSALLNTLPAVAEAYYRHLPLLVISADRPTEWIGQLDGQTLPQEGALTPYTETFHLSAAEDATANWHNQLLINRALLRVRQNGGQPVHINIPIREPLFSFQTAELPVTWPIREEMGDTGHPISDETVHAIQSARLPIVIVGQYEKGTIPALRTIEENNSLLVLPEIISGQAGSWRTTWLEQLLPHLDFRPDLVIHIGGNLVNKQLKLHIRKISACSVIRIDETGQVADTFQHLRILVRATPQEALSQLASILPPQQEVQKWKTLLDQGLHLSEKYQPLHFSDIGILQRLSQRIPKHAAIHLANSSPVRNASCFLGSFPGRIFCNRGVNGIEGSLSTATGYAMLHPHITLAVIGDLSFFYDLNALWNTRLPSGLRILLFNNAGGQIFQNLPGLNQSPALRQFIAAAHTTTAQGVAQTYGLEYHCAHSYDEADRAIGCLLREDTDSPVLLEVFTDTADNYEEGQLLKQYYLKQWTYETRMETPQGI